MADFDLQGLLSQFNQGPSDDEKRRALTQALASAGFGILGARGVNGMQAIGQGGLLGMNAYSGALDDASKSRRAALSDANSAMGLQENMQKMKDADTLRKLQGQFAAQFGAPGVNAGQAPAAPTGPVPPPQMGGGSAASLMQSALGGAPAAPISPPQAAPQSAPQTAPQSGVPDKRALASMYQKQGDWWMQNGQPAKAQAFYDLAQKAIPQIKDTKTLTQNGKRVVVNFYNDGSHEIVPDVGPDAEKLNFQNTGGAIVGLDPYSGAPGSSPIPTSMTPGERASNGIANSRLELERQRNAREASNAPGTKPQLVNGQWVYPPSADAPTGRVVDVSGLQVPLTESQAKASAYVIQMGQASKVLEDLKKKGFDAESKIQQLEVQNAGGAGIPYVPGTGLAQRALSSDAAQKYHQAQLQWTEGALRFLTGANAPEQEVVRNVATYFPVPGERKEVIAQKAAARTNMEKAIAMASGKQGAEQAKQEPKAVGIAPDAVEAEMKRRGLM